MQLTAAYCYFVVQISPLLRELYLSSGKKSLRSQQMRRADRFFFFLSLIFRHVCAFANVDSFGCQSGYAIINASSVLLSCCFDGGIHHYFQQVLVCSHVSQRLWHPLYVISRVADIKRCLLV